MSNRQTFQVHANVNSDWGDSGLRVTITWYDEQGNSTEHRTWRRHVKTPVVEGSDWTAYAACQALTKMMADACQAKVREEEAETPLF